MKTVAMLRALATSAIAAAVLAGCSQTEKGFCFPDGNCEGAAASAVGGGAGAAGKGGPGGGSAGSAGGVSAVGGMTGGGGSLNIMGGGGSAGASGASTCLKYEVCGNQIDDDCDGKVDNIDFTKLQTCGNCDTDCTKLIKNATDLKCNPGASPGTAPGACDYTACAPNFYDLDKKRENGCEFGPCKKTGDVDIACDGLDNDCNGIVDDGIDLCSNERCGDCTVDCNKKFAHATGICQKADPNQTSCQLSTASCVIDKCQPGFYDANKDPKDGCEYQCTPTGPELCGNGADDDCDGLVDTADPDLMGDTPSDPQLNKECTNSDVGVCKDTKGKTQCVNNVVTCVGAPKPGELPELCNGKDDDCNGQVDDAVTDLDACGASSFGKCKKGQTACDNGVKTCVGEIAPDAEEVCNNIDDDCDDVIDGTAPPGPLVSCKVDADCGDPALVCRQLNSDGTKRVCAKPSKGEGDDCDVPPATPNPCKAGKQVCKNATMTCVGSVPASTGIDKCGEDSNCNGVLESTIDTMTDPDNCGECGKTCSAGVDHINFTCVNGQCVAPNDPKTKCELGYIDCDGNPNDCEKACTFLSEQEVCNGVDDNCDCKVDEAKDALNPNGVQVPTPDQACGVSPGAAADPNCGPKVGGVGIDVVCENGTFTCKFPSGYCDEGNPPSCAATADLCDSKDNNCNGVIDDPFKVPVKTTDALGAPCASDDGKPGIGDGECRAKGTFQCSADGKSTVCSVKGKTLKCGVVPGDDTYNQKPCNELCDGKDNDCDGTIDEPKRDDKGDVAAAADGNYLKPAVVKIGDSVWIHQYEVTRPSASGTTAGTGNGFWGDTGTPAGVPLDKTTACNDAPTAENPARVPWFNITPIEVEQTCRHMGGRVCKLSEWQGACRVNNVPSGAPSQKCEWGYNNACTVANPGKCNTAAFDFDTNKVGNQDGLLPTGSSALNGCFSNWTGFNTAGTGANPAGTVGVYDITGNLREITVVDATANLPQAARQYALMGGAFNSDEDGAKCGFSFYTVDSQFQLFSVGFRCCFDQYPD